MEERDLSYRRHHRNRVIRKKRKLLNELYGNVQSYQFFPFDNALAKGKIHCSCELCRSTKKRNGWKHQDKQQLLRESDWSDDDLQTLKLDLNRLIKIT